MARNYANLAQQQQDIVDQMMLQQQQQQQQHRRVNTDGPLLHQQQQSRNTQGGNVHGYSASGKNGVGAGLHGNILVDDEDDEEEEENNDGIQAHHHRRNQQIAPGAQGDMDENGDEEGDDDEFGLDNIDPEEIRQMMSDPRYAALFAAHYGNVQFKRGRGDEAYGFDEDDDEGPHQYIDFNKLPPEQQQYYLQHAPDELLDDEDNDMEDEGQGVRGIVGKGDGVGFFAEGDEDEGSKVKFNENAGNLQQKFTFDEEGRMLPEAESDYCEDLAEIYIQNGSNEDVVRYKAIHLMDKGPNYNLVDENGEKFQCQETGAHFEFLEMVSRLKRLQNLRVHVDKMIDDQNQKLVQKELQRQQQQQLQLQQQLLKQQQLQQQQISPQSLQNRSAQQQQHQRIESIQRSADLLNSSGRRQEPASANLNQKRFQVPANNNHVNMPTQENHQHIILTTETANGAYNVYGSAGNQNASNNNRQQRHSSTGVKNQNNGISQSKLLDTRSQAASNGGYLNTQPNHQMVNDFETEMSQNQQVPANQIISQEEEEEMLRRHQMVLMAPDNDEDEIVDLLGSQIQYTNPVMSQKSGGGGHHSGSIHQGSSLSKMSIINNQNISQQQNMHSLSHQGQQQRKPPITGSSQKVKKNGGNVAQPSQQVVQNSNNLKHLFNTNLNMLDSNNGQQVCYTEVNQDSKPTRQQQVAYNNFFKVGPSKEGTNGGSNTAAVAPSNLIQANHSRRNQHLDLKTQKELELYALSQQFLEHNMKGSILSSAPSNQRNQGHHQYATHTYFAQNTNPNKQTVNHQRSSKRQASAGGAAVFMNQGQNKQTSKKTRTSSTSQAFNTHYSGGANQYQNNNFGSSKFISHQPVPSVNNAANLVNSNVPAPPIVMVMNPSKQTQIQNILMNFYQNSNSRANNYNYDHRVYPTKVNNNNTNTTKQSQIVGGGGNTTKNKNSNFVDAGLKMGAPPSQSAGGVNNQFKTYSSNQGLSYPQNISTAAAGMDRKNIVTLQKQLQGSKQMMLKKPGTAGANQRNHNNLGNVSKTIDNTGMQAQNSLSIGNPNQQHQIIVQQIQNSVDSMDGSRPQSAIKKKSTGISPNSKANKQMHIINSGVNNQGMGRVTSNGKTASTGKAYHNSKYDALNPKYIQFKSRDTQHKKTNSYSLGGFSGSMSSYQKSSKAKNLNVLPHNSQSINHNNVMDTYQIHSTTNQNYQQQQQQQLYQSEHHHNHHQHGITFIESSMGNGGNGIDNLLMSGGTPSSTSQVNKKSLINQPIGQQLNIQHHQIYETSPPTQKQKGLSNVSGVTMKSLVGSTSGKSRQPNHIISCGGILSTKLASATVQDAASSSKMDMNAIMKKLTGKKQPETVVMGSYHTSQNTQQNHHFGGGGTFDGSLQQQEKSNNNRYSTGGVPNANANNHGHQMSFAGKKITQVSMGGGSGGLMSSNNQHQIDATKRLSVNLHSGFIGKIQQSNNILGTTAAAAGGSQQQNAGGTSKIRHSHSKSKGAGPNGSSTTQSRHASVVPSSHLQHNQLQSQTKSAKRINNQVTASVAPHHHHQQQQIIVSGGPLFASSKKSNRLSSGISYDYRSSERRCDTVS